MNLLPENETIEDQFEKSKYTSQAEAFLHMVRGENVFLSGPGGSGKTYVVKQFIDYAENVLHKKVAKTSTTGISATNFDSDGVTIHAWSGMGISKETYEDDKKYHLFNQKLWKKSTGLINKTDILIIDEVSMLSERAFHYVMKRIADSKRPKKQIIVLGDFTQLPPVSQSREKDDTNRFCYGTKDWEECHFTELYLDRLFRAKDEKLAKVLDLIASGRGNEDETFQILSSLKKVSSQIVPGSVALFTTNKNVDKINQEEHDKNEGELYLSQTVLSDELESEKYQRELHIPDTLCLKVGDTVMVTTNITDKDKCILQNGAIGTFIRKFCGFCEISVKGKVYRLEPFDFTKEKTVWEKDKNGVNVPHKEIVATVTQYPLKLAYAITVHKSQGQTFSDVTVDLTNCWAKNLGYVALSRAQSLDGISLYQKGNCLFSSNALLVEEKSVQIKNRVMEHALLARDKQRDIKEFLELQNKKEEKQEEQTDSNTLYTLEFYNSKEQRGYEQEDFYGTLDKARAYILYKIRHIVVNEIEQKYDSFFIRTKDNMGLVDQGKGIRQ